MNGQIIPFGPGALTFVGFYLLSLLVIGWAGFSARRGNSMRDFYLGGRGIGVLALLLTLYATQYSGNTLFGFTGKAYRIGFSWIMSIQFMTAIVVFYLLFAPSLHAVARRKGFITPTDFLHHRFCSRGIDVVATVVMVVALSNYLLAQLTAMGRALEGLTHLDSKVAFTCGVVVLALIIVVYETLGGFRAVVWTDVIQGLVLMVGFGILLVLVFCQFGSIETASRLLSKDAESVPKVLPPDWSRCREWGSYILLVGIGGALYPQAIQRIYAARSAAILRRSLAIMVFLPLTTTLIALIVGIMGAAHVPGLETSDKILGVILAQIQGQSLFGYWLVVVLFAAILAAIMSTADSVLLSISSMLTKDLYARFIRPEAGEGELTRLGKHLSWILVALLAGLAIALNLLPNKPTLIKLLDMKFDMLIQLAPAFMISIHWSRLRSGPVLIGMIIGLAIALGLGIVGFGKILGIHAGLFGLVANLLIAVFGSLAISGHRARRWRYILSGQRRAVRYG